MSVGGAIRVLVVEDNSALANVLRFNLERAGHSVCVARNGREGWDNLTHQPFDLIISDHQMPEISGVELCRLVRSDERFHDLPFMLVTAKRFELDIEHIHRELGITKTFSKPFSPAAIVSAVGDLMSLAH